MRVFIERKVNESTVRGPGKFIVRLCKAMERIGITCTNTYSPCCDISLALSWWPQIKKGMPRVVRVDGLTISSNRIRDGYSQSIAKNILGCNGIIWQSRFCGTVIKEILGISASNEFVIHNGVEYQPNIQPVGSKDFRHVLLCSNWLRSSGSTRTIKRLKFMLDVAREYAKQRPEVIFWIAGKNNYTHIEHPNLRFLGSLPSEQLDRYIFSANCSLFLGCYDACPNSVVESLVIGTPVICVNGSGPEELVRLGHGEVLPIDKPATAENMKAGKIAPLDMKKVIDGLNRWVDCKKKKPAEPLFIDRIAMQYKAAFEKVLSCR